VANGNQQTEAQNKRKKRDCTALNVQADTVGGNGKLNQDVIFMYCQGKFFDVAQGEQWGN
jgi:hypothetical protein